MIERRRGERILRFAGLRKKSATYQSYDLKQSIESYEMEKDKIEVVIWKEKKLGFETK